MGLPPVTSAVVHCEVILVKLRCLGGIPRLCNPFGDQARAVCVYCCKMYNLFVDYIWLHVRGVGEWTNRLYEYFEQEHARLNADTPQAIHELVLTTLIIIININSLSSIDVVKGN
jgi:hypothetical protein